MTHVDAQTQPNNSTRQAERDGELCRQDLAALDPQFEQYRKSSANAGTEEATSRLRKYEHLREAARILGEDGRFDACRMVTFEIREMWDYEKSPMRGTNTP
ncbi:hypothetical protein LMTR13_12760 [Bradyrhizobium icense]|uniref:Uncharacterized protein n=2 Tax=Bradyrhizobium icense TaxID=1274631 RepID=A0A1B1UDT3_9BRAD|nr:hypothetical protein LMTR13_12760 [Bradyrhizobium icense]